eukprot:4886243-Prymnesium_polylepis.2
MSQHATCGINAPALWRLAESPTRLRHARPGARPIRMIVFREMIPPHPCINQSAHIRSVSVSDLS